MVMEALEEVGGKAWLVALAREEPRSFAQMLGKLIPQEIEARVDTDVVLRLNVGKREQEKLIADAREVPRLAGKAENETGRPSEDIPVGHPGRPDPSPPVERSVSGDRWPASNRKAGPSIDFTQTLSDSPDDPREDGACGDSGAEVPDREFVYSHPEGASGTDT